MNAPSPSAPASSSGPNRPHGLAGHARAAGVFLLMLVLLTGAIYPLALSGFAFLVAPSTSAGSLVSCSNGTVVGSTEVGQNFSAGALGPGLFWARPSLTDFNTTLGATTPPGPSDPATRNATWALVNETVAYLELYGNTSANASVPLWLVSPSGSSVDPDITVGGALVQVLRVAAVDNLSVRLVTDLVNGHITEPPLPFFGVPFVNVLELDLAVLHVLGAC